MAKTYEELLEQAAIIRDETAAGKNTATRVGGTITDAVDYVKELQDTYAGIHAEAAEAKTEAAAAKVTAAEAKTAAGNALTNAKGAVLTANAASGTATEAKANADAAKSTAEGIAATAQAAKDVADAANIAAQDAKAAADGVAETAQDAKDVADAAKTTADQAKQSATNAFNNARDAILTANSASGTATEAKKAADEAKAGLEEAVRNLNDEDVRLNGLITANTTEIAGVKSTAETAYNYALSAQSTAETAQTAAENEATARIEADTELQSQINGKQDNIGSFSKDEKAAFLVSLGLGKIGVVSQKQNWKSDYSSYTVSDVVKGIIPQYIIDHWISLSSEEKRYDGIVYFRFNEETGYFECNDLVDITLNDAINIMQYGQAETFYKNPSGTKKVRVVFCANLDSLWARKSYLGTGLYTERVYCQGILSIQRCFSVILDGYDLVNCPRLRDVLYINLGNNTRTFTFNGLNSLTTFLGIKMKGNFSFKYSPLLSNDSILFLINHEEATSAITITLHPDAYARVMANADILAALETHTNVSLASAQ